MSRIQFAVDSAGPGCSNSDPRPYRNSSMLNSSWPWAASGSYCEEDAALAMPMDLDTTTDRGIGTSCVHRVQMVGKYRLGRTLGLGITSAVRLGRNMETGQLVAVKAVQKRKAMQREAAALAALSHPNIIKLLDTITVDPGADRCDGDDSPGPDHVDSCPEPPAEAGFYLVLEQAGGGDLLAVMRDVGAMDEALARTYFRQLAQAVHHCHSRGVAHRDIKPGNLLLDDRGALKVADFGISVFVEDAGGARKRKPLRWGTRCNMPPEMVAAGGTFPEVHGFSADVWACGLVLFRMLTGRRPFEPQAGGDHGGAELSSLVGAAAADRRDTAGSRTCSGRYRLFVPEGISPGAANLLARLLDPDPTTRITWPLVLAHDWLGSTSSGNVVDGGEVCTASSN